MRLSLSPKMLMDILTVGGCPLCPNFSDNVSLQKDTELPIFEPYKREISPIRGVV